MQEAEAPSTGSERENAHRNGGGGGAWLFSKRRGRALGTPKRRGKRKEERAICWGNSLPGARCRCQDVLLLLSFPHAEMEPLPLNCHTDRLRMITIKPANPRRSHPTLPPPRPPVGLVSALPPTSLCSSEDVKLILKNQGRPPFAPGGRHFR